MPKILFDQKAEKGLIKLLRQDKEKVARAVAQMRISPFESLNVKRYQDSGGKFYRVRVGKIRIIFEFDSKTDTVFISDINYRGNIY